MTLLKEAPFVGPVVAYLIISSTIAASLWTVLQVFEVPSVVEMPANTRLPRWLLLIFGALFFSALLLIVLLAVVNARRSRNKTLIKIEAHITNIEELESPLRIFLLNHVLNSTLESIRSIKNQAEKEDIQKELGKYRTEVQKLLNKADKDTTILALCGEKGLGDLESMDYFEDFFRYAKSNHRHLKGVGGIRICRIFVESTSGGFDKTTIAVINEHRAHEAHGVIALEVPEESHRDLKEYREIIERLDKGVGYVLFLKPREVYAITHEGVEKNLTYMEFGDSLNFLAFLRMFKTLCIRSNEYRKNEATRKELISFFNRVQIPID